MKEKKKRKIILEDGREFYGYAFGSSEDRVCEIVFNTSMAGYQEILSDLSYTDQAVVMTYPLIGNYGMAAEDYESITPSIGALIVREYNDEPSNFRSVKTLGEVMEEDGIPGISGVDTRALTRSIRDYGTRKALITNADMPLAEGLALLHYTILPTNAVSRVSCRDPWTSESFPAFINPLDSKASTPGRPLRIAAVDCGMKRNIVRSLNHRGCHVTVLPWNTPAERIRALQPDGILLSNGPGDPTDVPQTIAAVRSLIGSFPIFGICLGCQIILDHSEEGDVDCLGLIPGTVRRFPSGGLKVPEIGWNSFDKVQDHYLLKDIPASPDVYFVHSYYPAVESKYGIARTEYMVPFYSIISRDNVAAAQFHPEKSGPVGIQIMRNFIQCEA